MSSDDVNVVVAAVEDLLASHNATPEDIARAAMVADPRVSRLREALRAICNQTDGNWAIKLARAALADSESSDPQQVDFGPKTSRRSPLRKVPVLGVEGGDGRGVTAKKV
jgi:hypothetical protein